MDCNFKVIFGGKNLRVIDFRSLIEEYGGKLSTSKTILANDDKFIDY